MNCFARTLNLKNCAAVVVGKADSAAIPPVGSEVRVTLDWERRYRHMRMHTAMHLLGSVLKYGVTGGNISAVKSRLDFDMEDTRSTKTLSVLLCERWSHKTTL